jgi:hypothetical protein
MVKSGGLNHINLGDWGCAHHLSSLAGEIEG